MSITHPPTAWADSEQNRRECEAWCKQDPKCDKCSPSFGCGAGYQRIRSFRGRGKNRHACAQRGDPSDSFTEASRQNKDACIRWCKDHSQCLACSSRISCAKGYRHLKTFGGLGANWYACGRPRTPSDAFDRASAKNKAACEKWCSSNPSCTKCSTRIGCGRGFKRLKSWRRRGRNWHACGER